MLLTFDVEMIIRDMLQALLAFDSTLEKKIRYIVQGLLVVDFNSVIKVRNMLPAINDTLFRCSTRLVYMSCVIIPV